MKSPPPQITLLTGWELIESLIASGPFLPNPFFRFLPLSEAKSTLGDSCRGAAMLTEPGDIAPARPPLPPVQHGMGLPWGCTFPILSPVLPHSPLAPGRTMAHDSLGF